MKQITPRTVEIVRSVNEALDIDNDPVGVIGWWAQSNGRIGCSPFALLLTDDEEDVLKVLAATLEPL